MTSASIIAVLVVALLAVCATTGLAWRWGSRRILLPCPSTMAWMFQGSFVDWWTATARTLDRIGLRPGNRVLEVGPGPGRLLIPAAERVLPGGEVVGLDVQQGMIDRLRRRAASTSNLAVVFGNAEQMSVESASFDVVYLSMVLGEIPDRPAALAEVYRVLKPGGHLSITELLADPHFQSQATVDRLARAAGFEPQAVQGRWYSYTANFAKPTVEA